MIEMSETMLRLASSLAQDVAELHSHKFGSQYRFSVTPGRPSDQVQEELVAMTNNIQGLAEEFVEQPILPSSPHSLAKMHDSAVDHGHSSLPPESYDQSYPYLHLEVVKEV